MTHLDAIQRLLWRLITAPEGVRAALSDDRRRGGGLGAALEAAVAPGPRLDAAGRVEIYANMYFYRLLDVIAEAYPATRALLGPTSFHNLITTYLLSDPPRHFSIRHAGQRLPECLAVHPVRERHPYVADLSRFERALADSFDAADGPVVSAAALAEIAPRRWHALRFELHPSVRLLECGWPVQQLRARVDAGDAAGAVARADTHLCVWRHVLEVSYRPLEAVEGQVLAALGRGADFGSACAAAAGAEIPKPEARLAEALARWLADGLFTGVHLAD